jgi:hypothetical protein
MSDIVERLRTMAVEGMHSWPDFEREADKHALEDAADEITRLRAEVAGLRDGMRTACEVIGESDPWSCEEASVILERHLTSTIPTAEAHDRRVRNEALNTAQQSAERAIIATCSAQSDRLEKYGKSGSYREGYENGFMAAAINANEAIRSLIKEGE